MGDDDIFGVGSAYCLGLFLVHANQKRSDDSYAARHWFNGASDHIYGLKSPPRAPAKLKKRIEKFKEKCLRLGHGWPEPVVTEADIDWSIKEAVSLLKLIDDHYGVKTKRSRYP